MPVRAHFALPLFAIAMGVLLVCWGVALRGPAVQPVSAASFPTITFQGFAGGFTNPTYVTNAGDSRLFVVEQGGTVRIVMANGSVVATPFLNLSARLTPNPENEEGLLSIALPSPMSEGDWFYVYFTNVDSDIEIGRVQVSAADPNVADEGTYDELLVIPHPGEGNHNGGQLQLHGGALYAATGDGGGGGCSSATPCPARPEAGGSLGRLFEVNRETGAIENEVGVGLRNPWRFSFNGSDLYIGDVGQGSREEVNRVTFTGSEHYDFGWNVMEGTECAGGPGPPPCNDDALTDPVFDYSSASPASECSVTGGYVYQGFYFFGDFCTGKVWALQGMEAQVAGDAGSQLTSFGLGADGSLYAVLRGGSISRAVVQFPPQPTNSPTSPATTVPPTEPGATNTSTTQPTEPSPPAGTTQPAPTLQGTQTPGTATSTPTSTPDPTPLPSPVARFDIPGLSRQPEE